MKSSTKTASIFTALLAGTIIAGAHPHSQGHDQWQQQDRQGSERQGPRQFQGRHRAPHQFQGHRQESQQFQGRRQGCPQCGTQQVQEHQGQRGSNPKQQKQMSRKKHQRMLNKFDADQDGRLSDEERRAGREAMEKYRRNKPGVASDQPEPPPSEE